MRIGIDGRGASWYKGTGIGTYTNKLLKHMLNIDEDDYFHIYWWGENFQEVLRHNSKITFTSRKHHRFFEQHYFPYNTFQDGIDLFHIPQNGIGLTELIKCKKVVTIHDLIPYIMPETVGKGYLNKFLKELPNVISVSDGILTVSEYSKKDIIKFFNVDENKVFVTPLAADDIYKPLDKIQCNEILKNFYGINKPYILYIGGFSKRKNVSSLIKAFSKVNTDLKKDMILVIVGGNKEEYEKLIELSNAFNICNKILFTGYVPEEHLPLLYNGCDVFVYPSLYEGFGLPPLEAMSCGTPVITSNLTSIPEVVKDCGILIDPYSLEELESSLLSIINNDDLREHYAKKGLEHSKDFSWENTAKLTLNCYNSILSS